MLYVSDLVFSTSNMRVLNIGFHMLVELLPLVQTADEVSDLWPIVIYVKVCYSWVQ